MEEIPNYLKDKLLRPAGGFSKSDLEILGVDWPPPRGWKKEVMKRLQLEAQYKNKKQRDKEERRRKKRERRMVAKSQRRVKKINTNRREQAKALNQPFVPYKKKREADKAFYASWEWKKLRFEILKKYGPVCMLCKSEDRIVVDHIKPRSRFPHLELDPDNMQVLCDDCNRGKSNDDYTDFRPAEGMLTDAEYDELKIVNQAREVLH